MGADGLPPRALFVDPARRRARRPVRAPRVRDRHGVVRGRVCCAARHPTSKCSSARECCKASARHCLTPGSLAILQVSFRQEDRAQAVGAWSGLGGVAGAIGPFLGGWLVDGPGWRWAFLINVPSPRSSSSAPAAVPETRDPHAARASTCSARDRRGEPRRRDVGAHRSRTTRLDRLPRRRRRRDRGRRCRRVRVAHAPHGRSARSADALPQSRVHGHEPGDGLAVLLDRRVVLPRRLRAAGRGGLVGVASGHRAPARDVPDAVVLVEVGSSPSASVRGCSSRSARCSRQRACSCCRASVPTRRGCADVLPGAVVFGLGLVTFVAPLTATVMGAVDPDHVSVGSGVNNAIARTASLAALAVIPVVSGLSVATGAESDGRVPTALVIAAVIVAAAAPLSFVGLGAAPPPDARRAASTARSTGRRSSPIPRGVRSRPPAEQFDVGTRYRFFLAGSDRAYVVPSPTQRLSWRFVRTLPSSTRSQLRIARPRVSPSGLAVVLRRAAGRTVRDQLAPEHRPDRSQPPPCCLGSGRRVLRTSSAR